MPSHLKSAGGIIVPINSLQLIPNETYTLDGHNINERESRAEDGEYSYSLITMILTILGLLKYSSIIGISVLGIVVDGLSEFRL